MGFGSYDESEQESSGEADIDEDEGVTVHEHDHEGEVIVEGAEATDELLDRLNDLK